MDELPDLNHQLTSSPKEMNVPSTSLLVFGVVALLVVGLSVIVGLSLHRLRKVVNEFRIRMRRTEEAAASGVQADEILSAMRAWSEEATASRARGDEMLAVLRSESEKAAASRSREEQIFAALKAEHATLATVGTRLTVLEDVIGSTATKDHQREARLRHLAQGIKATTTLGHQNEARLRQIGQMVETLTDALATPDQPSTEAVGRSSLTASQGRIAAMVARDPERSQRIAQALSPPARQHCLTITTPALRDSLVSEGLSVTPLHVGRTSHQLSVHTPSMVVIEEAALLRGQWAGSLSATGTQMFAELTELLHAARAEGAESYFVASMAAADNFTEDLRRVVDVTVDGSEFDEDWTEGTRLRFPDLFQNYLRGTASRGV